MRKKIKTIINKYDNILVILLAIILTAGWCLNIIITTGDELFTFQNIGKMLHGYKIYTDANVITTPLFFYIGYIILKIFGTNLMVYRFYNILIQTFMLSFIYLNLKLLCKNKFRAFCYFIVIFGMIMKIAMGGANYNILAIDFVLLGIYVNLKFLEKDRINDVWQAIIMFLVFITKQNVGIYYMIAIIAYQLLIHKKSIKDIIKQVLILFVLISIVILIYLKQGILHDFINMTVLGISEFGNENFFGSIFDILTLILWSIACIGITIFLDKTDKISQLEKNKTILIMCMAVIMQFVKYPIFNIFHNIMGNVVLSIFVFYVIDLCFLKHVLSKNKVTTISIIIATIIYMTVSIYYCIKWIKNVNQSELKSTDYYYGGFFNSEGEETYENYINVTNYIKKQDKKVIIFSCKAALYLIPLEINNGAMDLPLYGNMGKNGEEEMLKEIQNTQNAQFLLTNQEDGLVSGQESERLNQYIRENLNYVGEIGEFEIYEE